MWVEKRKDNRYKFVEQYRDPLTNKKKRVSITYDKNTSHTRKEAQLVLEQRIQDATQNPNSNIKDVRLAELIEKFKINYKERVRSTTYTNKLLVLKNIEIGLGSDSIVSKITPKLIKAFLGSLLYQKHLSNGYVSKYKFSLHQLFTFAMEQNYAKHNPVNDVTIEFPNNEKAHSTRNKFLEQSELHKLLKFAYSYNVNYANLCEWLYLTGMRVGEACALGYEDIIQHNNTWFAKVTGTMMFDLPIDQQKKSPQPKTNSGFREVSLSQRAIEIYKERKVNNPANSKFVFCTFSGTPIQLSAFNSFLRTAKEKTGIEKPLSSHIFRHTHISKLAELGVPLYVIQKRVGHSNSNITQEIYLHVTNNAEKELINKLNDF